MSDGPRIPVDKALKIAMGTVMRLADACHRIEVAGSLRRAWRGNTAITDVGDIDIVCTPRMIETPGLFAGTPASTTSAVDRVLDEAVQQGGLEAIKRGAKLRSFNVRKHGVRLEVKSVPLETFGVALAIHTGPAELSHALVTPKPIGALPQGVRVGGGDIAWVVTSGNDTHHFGEEDEFFEFIELPWMTAADRRWPL